MSKIRKYHGTSSLEGFLAADGSAGIDKRRRVFVSKDRHKEPSGTQQQTFEKKSSRDLWTHVYIVVAKCQGEIVENAPGKGGEAGDEKCPAAPAAAAPASKLKVK